MTFFLSYFIIRPFFIYLFIYFRRLFSIFYFILSILFVYLFIYLFIPPSFRRPQSPDSNVLFFFFFFFNEEPRTIEMNLNISGLPFFRTDRLDRSFRKHYAPL